MKRIFSVLVASAFGLMLFASMAHADDAAIRQELQAQYEAMVQSALKGDTAAFEKATHPDLKYIDLLGKEASRDGWIQGVKQTMTAIKGLKLTANINTLMTKGDEATAIVQIKYSGDGPGPDGKEGPLDVSLTHRDTWAKDGDAWKLKLAKEVMIEGKYNNRTLRFPAPPTAEEARKALQPLYDAIGDLYTKQDFASLEKGTPTDTVITDANGNVLTKQELSARVKNGAKDLTDPIMSITIQQIASEGEKVTLVRVMKLLADIKLPNGSKGRVKYVSVARDIWTKKEDKWASKSSAELHSEAYLDGKMVPLAAIGGK